jgi:hypothetical protein
VPSRACCTLRAMWHALACCVPCGMRLHAACHVACGCIGSFRVRKRENHVTPKRHMTWHRSGVELLTGSYGMPRLWRERRMRTQ